MAENRMYLTTAPNPNGKGLLAIISQGQPQLGDVNVTVLTLEIVKNMKEVKSWYRRMKIERPWEARN